MRAPSAITTRHRGLRSVPPPPPSPPMRSSATTSASHRFAESLRERVDQRTDSIAQAREQAPARAAGAAGLAGLAGFRVVRARCGPQSPDYAAMAGFHLDKARQRGVQAELLRIGGVDSAGERLRDALEDLAAEAAAHERRQALVTVAAAARNQRLDRHPRLAERGKQRASQHRQ